MCLLTGVDTVCSHLLLTADNVAWSLRPVSVNHRDLTTNVQCLSPRPDHQRPVSYTHNLTTNVQCLSPRSDHQRPVSLSPSVRPPKSSLALTHSQTINVQSRSHPQSDHQCPVSLSPTVRPLMSSLALTHSQTTNVQSRSHPQSDH